MLIRAKCVKSNFVDHTPFIVQAMCYGALLNYIPCLLSSKIIFWTKPLGIQALSFTSRNGIGRSVEYRVQAQGMLGGAISS